MGRGEDQRHAIPGEAEEASEAKPGTAAEPGASGAEPGASGAEPGASGAEPGASGAEPGDSAAGPAGEPEDPDAPRSPRGPSESEAPEVTGAPPPEPEAADEPPEPEARDEPPEPEAGGVVSDGDPESLAAALHEAERTRDQYLDLLQRERAEFENFRRRANRERGEALDRGAESVITALLGVLDNFGFVLEAAEQSDDAQLAKGVSMVHDELVRSLEAAGLERVPGEGAPFDPNHHEAMMQVEADEDVAEPTVVQVLRPGYRFKGRVLRPASVSVAQ